MTNSQVITIHADGSVSGLQRKRGQGLDLRTLGRAEIERASEIVWIESIQRWAVKILTGTYAGYMLTEDMALHHKIDIRCDVVVELGGRRLLTFDEYEDAVKAEIAFLDGIRLQGHC